MSPKKIVQAVAEIETGRQDCLYLGNLDAKRDWGHAKDYVEGMWRIVQADVADDFVLATGRTETVRSFVELAFSSVGVGISWSGEGVNEIGSDSASGRALVKIDPRYFRPTEVDLLIGDPSKAMELLGWRATAGLETLVEEMMRIALHNAKQPKPNRLLADF